MKEKRSIEDILTLVEQNFEFLHIGMFLSHYYIKEHNLAVEAKNIDLNLEKNKGFVLRGDIIRDSFSESFIKCDQGNILGYFVEWNAFRGIAMAIHEGISKNSDFEKFIESILKKKYKHFKCIIAFIRNVLSHNIDSEIRLIKEDFEPTGNKFKKDVQSGVASLEFIYSRDFPEKNALPEDYGFNIQIQFCNLEEGNKFTDIVPEWHLFMIMELCRNVVGYYRRKHLTRG